MLNTIRNITYLSFIIAAGYILANGIFVLALNSVSLTSPASIITFVLVVYLAAHITQLIAKRQHMDLVLGTINFAITGYLVLAILDDYIDWKAGRDNYANPTQQLYITGFIIFTMFALAIAMICVDGNLKKKEIKAIS